VAVDDQEAGFRKTERPQAGKAQERRGPACIKDIRIGIQIFGIKESAMSKAMALSQRQ